MRERVARPRPDLPGREMHSTSPQIERTTGGTTMKRRDMLIGAVSGAAGIATIAAVTQSPQALAQTAPALASGGVLDRIIKEKKLRVTAEVTSPPFGILDRINQPDAPEIETARQLSQDLGVELVLVQATTP